LPVLSTRRPDSSAAFACRNGELRANEKSHFDFDEKVWTIPTENHKMGKTTGKPLLRPIRPQIEPLLRQATALSDESKFLFTNTGSNEAVGTSAPLALPYHSNFFPFQWKDAGVWICRSHCRHPEPRSNLSVPHPCSTSAAAVFRFG
jgi:hypothetical protein